MELQHPSPPEPPIVIPPNPDLPDPADPMRRGPDRHLPPARVRRWASIRAIAPA